MAPTTSHSDHIGRHLSHVGGSGRGASAAERLRDEAGLVLVDGSLAPRGRAAFCRDDCAAYLEAVKKILGDAAYSFARVNFIMAGCDAARNLTTP